MPAKHTLSIAMLLTMLLTPYILGAASTAAHAEDTTPQGLRAHAIARLKAVAPALSSEARASVDGAVKKIEASLRPDSWVDERHLRHGFAQQAPDHITGALEVLTGLSEDASTWPVEGELQDVIGMLVRADGILAEVAFREADAVPGLDFAQVAQAQDDINEAKVALMNGEFEKAVRHYAKARKTVTEPGIGSVVHQDKDGHSPGIAKKAL